MEYYEYKNAMPANVPQQERYVKIAGFDNRWKQPTTFKVPASVSVIQPPKPTTSACNPR